MMSSNPELNDLLKFIKKVPRYPISAGEVTQYAKEKGAHDDVINFYRSFPDHEIFSDKEDLVVRSESIEIMQRDEQPREFYRAPEED